MDLFSADSDDKKRLFGHKLNGISFIDLPKEKKYAAYLSTGLPPIELTDDNSRSTANRHTYFSSSTQSNASQQTERHDEPLTYYFNGHKVQIKLWRYPSTVRFLPTFTANSVDVEEIKEYLSSDELLVEKIEQRVIIHDTEPVSRESDITTLLYTHLFRPLSCVFTESAEEVRTSAAKCFSTNISSENNFSPSGFLPRTKQQQLLKYCGVGSTINYCCGYNGKIKDLSGRIVEGLVLPLILTEAKMPQVNIRRTLTDLIKNKDLFIYNSQFPTGYRGGGNIKELNDTFSVLEKLTAECLYTGTQWACLTDYKAMVLLKFKPTFSGKRFIFLKGQKYYLVETEAHIIEHSEEQSEEQSEEHKNEQKDEQKDEQLKLKYASLLLQNEEKMDEKQGFIECLKLFFRECNGSIRSVEHESSAGTSAASGGNSAQSHTSYTNSHQSHGSASTGATSFSATSDNGEHVEKDIAVSLGEWPSSDEVVSISGTALAHFQKSPFPASAALSDISEAPEQEQAFELQSGAWCLDSLARPITVPLIEHIRGRLNCGRSQILHIEESFMANLPLESRAHGHQGKDLLMKVSDPFWATCLDEEQLSSRKYLEEYLEKATYSIAKEIEVYHSLGDWRGVPKVFGFGTLEDCSLNFGYGPRFIGPFLVVEKLDTVSWSRVSHEKRISLFENTVKPMFAHLHANNILHNDVSWDNILYCTDGSVKVIDFEFAVRGFEDQEVKDKEMEKVRRMFHGIEPYGSPSVFE